MSCKALLCPRWLATWAMSRTLLMATTLATAETGTHRCWRRRRHGATGPSSTFEPVGVPKGSRRLSGRDDMVISLYAKGVTTGVITAHLSDISGQHVARGMISRITDSIVGDMVARQNRPPDEIYPVILVDAIVLKIRDGKVTNRPV